jgi:hypothetical protein
MSTTTTDIQQIADSIHADIAGMQQAEADWSSYVLSLCQHVAEAKAHYPALQDFGKWWDAQNFDLNADTRAALVAMGQDIDRAKEVLAVTDRRSIHTVYTHEFRFRNISKTTPDNGSPTPSRKRGRAQSAVTGTVGADHWDWKATGRELFAEALITGAVQSSRAEIIEQFPGCPDRASGYAIGYASALFDAAGMKPEDIEQIMRDKVWAFITKDVQEKVRYAERFLFHKNTAAPLTVPEFKTLLFALHPDQTTEEHRTNALSIIKAKKEILTVDEVFFKPAPALPTFEDYMAAKKQATADRKAKKAKKEAA